MVTSDYLRKLNTVRRNFPAIIMVTLSNRLRTISQFLYNYGYLTWIQRTRPIIDRYVLSTSGRPFIDYHQNQSAHAQLSAVGHGPSSPCGHVYLRYYRLYQYWPRKCALPPTARQNHVQKVRERISDIYLRSFASAWCCIKTAQILTPSLIQIHRLTEGDIAVNQ